MKKIAAIFMSIFILTGFTACSNAGNETAETQSAATAARNEEKGANTDLIQEGKILWCTSLREILKCSRINCRRDKRGYVRVDTERPVHNGRP